VVITPPARCTPARSSNKILYDDASFIEGISLLANMRLCPNVPAQYAIQVALGGHQSIEDLVLPVGRLLEHTLPWARDLTNAIERLGNFLRATASDHAKAPRRS
jgi:hypothetical protein